MKEKRNISYPEAGSGKNIIVPHTYKDQHWQKDVDWSKYSNEDLLQWVDKAKSVPEVMVPVLDVDGEEHTVVIKGTLAFQTYFQTEFDYGQLTRELERRGAVCGYHFSNMGAVSESVSSEPIILDLNTFHRNDPVRLQLTVSKEVQDKFDALVSIQNTQDKSIVTEMLLTYAIDRLLEKKARKEIIIRRDQEVTRVETVDTPM